LREERYDEAPAYFDNAELQAKATWYGQLRKDAESKWWPTTRAFSYYYAATLARYDGMALLGYEMSPDYATFDGNYSLEAPELKVGPLLAEGEIKRQQATVAQPDERFHYRYVATALASKAADHLPRSSQAFASVLCKASNWGTSLEEQSAFYQRYVEQGPYVVWAGDFGHQCQDPDFQNADKRYVTQFVDSLRSTLRPYKRVLQVCGVLLVTATALLLINRRRRHKAQ